jgi:DNA-directed RNA polymerase specialized sigma24 family protein
LFRAGFFAFTVFRSELRYFWKDFPKNLQIGAVSSKSMPPKLVNPTVMAALNGPGWDHTFSRAVLHADTTIRKYIWRGFRPKFTKESEIAVGNKSATDFVLDAVEKLLQGRRTYDSAKDLLSNLNSITDSLIWSEKKRSDRTGLVDHVESTDEDGGATDPISTAQDSRLSADQELIECEFREDQRRCFNEIRASFDGDKQTQEYLDALHERIFKRSEISDVTGIPPEKIDDLRRKLMKHARRLFGVPDFESLLRRLNKGK